MSLSGEAGGAETAGKLRRGDPAPGSAAAAPSGAKGTLPRTVEMEHSDMRLSERDRISDGAGGRSDHPHRSGISVGPSLTRSSPEKAEVPAGPWSFSRERAWRRRSASPGSGRMGRSARP